MSGNINFANTNSLWGSFLVESLFRLGVRCAVVSPGSRSAPLAHALAMHPEIRAVPVLDERSASFYALGVAKRTGAPVVLVCTSGTAAANYFPAVIEARESGVPLLVLTADRPPEMRECGSGQTIDQLKIFGNYPRWQVELSLPEASAKSLAYLRQTLRHACERAIWPAAGPVHVNMPFRDPLAPVPDGSLAEFDSEIATRLLKDLSPVEAPETRLSAEQVRRASEFFGEAERVVIVAGPAIPSDPAGYVREVVALSERLSAPILADALSPVRQRGVNLSFLVDNYEFLLARKEVPEETPDLIIRLGPLPTSKSLRAWLESLDCMQVVIDGGDRNIDPLHSRCVHLRTGVPSLVEDVLPLIIRKTSSTEFVECWVAACHRIRKEVDAAMEQCQEMFEGKVPWLLARHCPVGAVVFVSNSTPIRDAELFWRPGEHPVEVYFNRGANGIDGIVSTAIGVAGEADPVFLLTGDLAFLHDQNGLLNSGMVRGGLTILLINNGGGGIFRALPVANFDPPFEEFFLTPQKVDFSALCKAYGIDHEVARDWGDLEAAIAAPKRDGVRVIEVRTRPERDREYRLRLLKGEAR